MMQRCRLSSLRKTSSIPTNRLVTWHVKSRPHSALAKKVEHTRPRPDPISIQPDILFPHSPSLTPPQPQPQLQPRQRSDPHALVAPELAHLRGSLLNLLGAAHPGLNEIAQCYFFHPTKQLRPLLVLLFAHATNGLGGGWEQKRQQAEREVEPGALEELNRPLMHPDVLHDWHPSMPDTTASFESVFELQTPRPPTETVFDASILPSRVVDVLNPGPGPSPLVVPAQMRLAHIVEMIHVASLLHDEILDNAALETNAESSPNGFGFGNKLSILGGDFLLGRASTALSRLGDSQVVELVASVISNLVEGEILRMTEIKTPELGVCPGPASRSEAWKLYLKKTYLKTASLMAKGARASVVLGGCKEGEVWSDVAYAYGRNLGIAYQLVNDSLDYEVTSPSLSPGLATGPALFAWEEHPELGPLIERNLSQKGDVEQTLHYVSKSSGVERSRLLAETYAERALQSLKRLPDSEAKSALEALSEQIIQRTW